jgi:hypothetical protein
MKLDLKSYEEKKLNTFFIQLRQFLAIPDNTWEYFPILGDTNLTSHVNAALKCLKNFFPPILRKVSDASFDANCLCPLVPYSAPGNLGSQEKYRTSTRRKT